MNLTSSPTPSSEPTPKLHQLGMLMGTSYQSSLEYYKLINDEVNARVGGLHSAPLVMRSVDFQRIGDFMENGQWQTIANTIACTMNGMAVGFTIEAFLVCSNTLHYAFTVDDTALPWNQPVIHIGDCLAAAVKRANLKTVALLGTQFTMSHDFLSSRIERSGARVVIPNVREQEEINRIIFEELCRGKRRKNSEQYLFHVIEELMIGSGVQGIILGCTELEQLLTPAVRCRFSDILRAKHPQLPRPVFFESMKIHASAAAEFIVTGSLPQSAFRYE